MELIVVIAIIGILMAIITPNYMSSIAAARQKADIAAAHEVKAAFPQYRRHAFPLTDIQRKLVNQLLHFQSPQ